jgi:iron-sulfur cluster assembly accessory protein
MISITDSAKNQIRELCENNNKWGVKLSVKGGGCAGFTYDWAFLNNETELEENDEVFHINERKFVIDGMSLIYVLGTKLDYKKEIFCEILINPNNIITFYLGNIISFYLGNLKIYFFLTHQTIYHL